MHECMLLFIRFTDKISMSYLYDSPLFSICVVQCVELVGSCNTVLFYCMFHTVWINLLNMNE